MIQHALQCDYSERLNISPILSAFRLFRGDFLGVNAFQTLPLMLFLNNMPLRNIISMWIQKFVPVELLDETSCFLKNSIFLRKILICHRTKKDYVFNSQ